MADEYDLAPSHDPKKPEDSLPTPPGTPEGFVPPKVIIEPPEQEPPSPEEIDATENHAAGALAYLCFVIPLVYAPKSAFARFHANQALVLQLHLFGLFVLMIVRSVVGIIAERVEAIKGIYGWGSCLLTPIIVLLIMALLVLAVQQALAAMDHERKKLPVIGNITLLKPLPEQSDATETR